MKLVFERMMMMMLLGKALFICCLFASCVHMLRAMPRYEHNSFDSSGKLTGLEFARKAAKVLGGPMLATGCDDGIFLITTRSAKSSKILLKSPPKVYNIDDNAIVACSGNMIITDSRLRNFKLKFIDKKTSLFASPLSILDVCEYLRDYVSQSNSMLPLEFIVAGWDRKLGYQIYQMSTDGTYAGWKTVALGAGSDNIMEEYERSLAEQGKVKDLQDLWQRTRKLVQKYYVRFLTESIDGKEEKKMALKPDDLEIHMITRTPSTNQIAWTTIPLEELFVDEENVEL